MQTSTWIALSVTVAVAITGFATVNLLRRRFQPEPPTSNPTPQSFSSDDAASPESTEIAYATEATEEISAQCLKLAFGVAQFDYHIYADHAQVLERVEAALGDAVNRQEYFPRRPLLLPKLLQAQNDTESTRQELVRLILEDPTLAGTTLKQANNAFYRMSTQPVESLDRAVTVLGVDGLRGLLSTAILQPVFRLPKGFFDRFADISWEQAKRSAAGGEKYAEMKGADDPFIAQLLGVLRSLASLVLFRMTLDKYREAPNALPRPEVFIRVLQQHRSALALEIAKTWQLSDASLAALDQQCRQLSPAHMSTLGQAVYYGELAGSLALAVHHDLHSAEGAHAMLIEQGLAAQNARVLLNAADAVDLKA